MHTLPTRRITVPPLPRFRNSKRRRGTDGRHGRLREQNAQLLEFRFAQPGRRVAGLNHAVEDVVGVGCPARLLWGMRVVEVVGCVWGGGCGGGAEEVRGGGVHYAEDYAGGEEVFEVGGEEGFFAPGVLVCGSFGLGRDTGGGVPRRSKSQRARSICSTALAESMQVCRRAEMGDCSCRGCCVLGLFASEMHLVRMPITRGRVVRTMHCL